MADELVKRSKIKMAGFAAKAHVAKADEPIASATAPNRLGLMLDNSGSMSSTDNSAASKLELLKQAVQGFLQACDWSNSVVALYQIPLTDGVPLTNQSALLHIKTMELDASGSTPMGDTMKQMLENEPITRGVLVSDGQPTDGDAYKAQALAFKTAGIPIDCVFIGSGFGEDVMKWIAETTGGIFILFRDVTSFAGAMKYLTPSYRGLLASPEVQKAIGATEVKL